MGFLDGVFGWGFWMGFLDGVFGCVGSGRSSLCIFLCCVRCGWSLLEMWEICGWVCSEEVFFVYFLLKSGICL